VTVEFNQEKEEETRRGDIICEMRFYVPNMEEIKNEGEEIKEKPKKVVEVEKKEGEDGDENVDEDAITPAKQFNDKIREFTGLGDAVGDVIASIKDLPLLVPRGKLDFEMYDTYAKLHGKTHNYKILYKDILKVFQLPRNDINKVDILIQLKKPLL